MPRACPGEGRGLVDTREARWIEVELRLEPLPAPLQHVGAVMLGGVRDRGEEDAGMRYAYDSGAQLTAHLHDFINACNDGHLSPLHT